ncbi:MAG: deoxyguanosinetriphosphate triphosphohydrolase [Planctomycetota bacterium]|jgi:dGTPase
MAHALTPRQRFEADQARRLAPCAVREADCGGRAVPEQPHPYRTCFQRDRDRIVHCSAFRRLDFKTQVFVPHEHDHFRTRLTHTLEVSQVGRSIGRALRLNEDLIEAVALAHDLGHPPFGHSGEEALNELMADEGGFEHNRQSLRVVGYLEHPYPAFRGLNLTGVVHECLAKHETRYDHPVATDVAAGQLPLEGQVIDLADEIAYTAADLDDALAAGWITADELSELAVWRRAWQAAEEACGDVQWIHKRIRARAAVLSMMIDDVVSATDTATASLTSLADVRAAGRRIAGFSEVFGPNVEDLQTFLRERVYYHAESRRHCRAGQQILGELFQHLTANPVDLPKRYRGRIDTDGLKRVVCDYVAGMTDRFCRTQHAALCR